MCLQSSFLLLFVGLRPYSRVWDIGGLDLAVAAAAAAALLSPEDLPLIWAAVGFLTKDVE